MTTIQCPHCHQPINIDQVLAHQIEETVAAKYQKDLDLRAKEQLALKDQLEQFKKTAATEKQKSLTELEQRLKQELWQKAQDEARKKISEISEKKMKELQDQLGEQEKRVKDAEAAELEMRKQQRELEQEKKQFELKLERELGNRVKEEQERFMKLEVERFSLKEREYQKQLEDMKGLVEEARRKASTVSQQLQGEVLELELENMLGEEFPHDSISEVKKGQFGADLLQTVKTPAGKTVGIIVWESKQTKEFKKEWLGKLREDCRACHGSIAVLVSRTLPEGVTTCAEIERVWVSAMDFVLPLAHLLRQTLLKVDQEKITQTGKDVKTEMLYRYINSQEFRGRVEGIVESFREMQADLDREERALQNIWKKREKQILRLATNTAYLYGEMQGIVGASLPSIQGLDLIDSPELSDGKDLFSEEVS